MKQSPFLRILMQMCIKQPHWQNCSFSSWWYSLGPASKGGFLIVATSRNKLHMEAINSLDLNQERSDLQISWEKLAKNNDSNRWWTITLAYQGFHENLLETTSMPFDWICCAVFLCDNSAKEEFICHNSGTSVQAWNHLHCVNTAQPPAIKAVGLSLYTKDLDILNWFSRQPRTAKCFF